MHRLITGMFLRHFGNPVLAKLDDGAVLQTRRGRMAVSTDTFVVDPLFFPGGDIGKLAVCGTVNDVAMMGGRPRHLTLGFVMREGLELAALERVCRSIAATAKRAGVLVVTGDTKVIEHGDDQGLYINSTGLGPVPAGVKLGPSQVRAGDVILINGPIGEHEAAVAVARGDFRFRGPVRSDCAPLHELAAAALGAGGVRMMRDPTRGGLATTLNEVTDATGLGMVIEEGRVPVSKHVRGVASLLGLDPHYMANEGKAVVIASAPRADRVLATMRGQASGRAARRIGEVVREPKGLWLKTRIGSLRPLIMLEGEQLPRIC
jgi:hydrogenase expression/formation protein HypE